MDRAFPVYTLRRARTSEKNMVGQYGFILFLEFRGDANPCLYTKGRALMTGPLQKVLSYARTHRDEDTAQALLDNAVALQRDRETGEGVESHVA